MLTIDDIKAAIAVGEGGREGTLLSVCPAGISLRQAVFQSERPGINSNGTYMVTFTSTKGRIAMLAAAAKRRYQRLLPQAVSNDLKRPAVIITAEPQEPAESVELQDFIKMKNPPPRKPKTAAVAPPIEHIVITPSKGTGVVQPSSLKIDPVEWPNVLGSAVRGTRAEARFDIREVRDLPAGPLMAVLVTAGGERKCGITAAGRQQLFGP